MKKLTCSHCATEMRFLASEQIQLGKTGFLKFSLSGQLIEFLLKDFVFRSKGLDGFLIADERRRYLVHLRPHGLQRGIDLRDFFPKLPLALNTNFRPDVCRHRITT